MVHLQNLRWLGAIQKWSPVGQVRFPILIFIQMVIMMKIVVIDYGIEERKFNLVFLGEEAQVLQVKSP